jgi:hypothetical protein
MVNEGYTLLTGKVKGITGAASNGVGPPDSILRSKSVWPTDSPPFYYISSSGSTGEETET